VHTTGWSRGLEFAPGGPGGSLKRDGCETIRNLRDQGDADHVTGLIQRTERHNYTDYFAWRTERGFTATFEAMLTQPSSFTTTARSITARASRCTVDGCYPVRSVLMAASSPSRSSAHGPQARRCAATSG
jgi:hypothetical protein